ncbi:hypothetical protein LOSG293_020780 [Secundilactobacillus oryzae JCM 18671]|uniref:Histidine kinase n=1 Tax=Secundilactobacillus oryzae JCM 18671 TaxID=1291743 RepID=A0A081BGH2_9LACO|nr:hypothetical protein [Secundilactobacillus oryzae]GAK47140.1 hypothetical protein LOSG293_020780 [Secundilactobacillus oryzae JCM 18671]
MLTLILLTFFLYDLDLFIYWDALMFAGFILVADFFLCFPGYLKRQRQLEFVKRASFSGETHLNLPKPANQTEQDYQTLIQTLLAQNYQQNEQFVALRTDLLNDFGLWLHQIKTPLAAMDLATQTGTEIDPVEIKAELIQVNDYLGVMLNYLKQNFDHEDLRFTEVQVKPILKRVMQAHA